MGPIAIFLSLRAQVRTLRSFRRDVLRTLYWQQRTKYPSITTLIESEAVLRSFTFTFGLPFYHA